MSRSYKKRPYHQDKYGAKSSANRFRDRKISRSVRHYKGTIPNGCAYKKLYDRWIFNDYITYCEWDIDATKHYTTKHEWAKSYYYK